MAVNPMQRRSRNSFIFGFIVAIILGVVVAGILLMQLKKAKENLKTEQSKLIPMPVATRDISDFAEIKPEDISTEYVRVTIPKTEVVDTIALFEGAGMGMLTGDSKVDTQSGQRQTKNKYLAKMKIPKGTVITNSMLMKAEEKDKDNLRLYELNMISLPSELQNNEVIDVRIMFPNGQDFIVLTKKIVEKSDKVSVWLKLTEEEIITLNCAIVESYLINGTKLYASVYTNPGIQKEAAMTYPLSTEAWNLLRKDANILDTARNELSRRHNATYENRTTHINPLKANAVRDGREEERNNKINREISDMKTKREEYIDSLAGY